MDKKPLRVKKSYSMSAPIAAWIEKVARIRAGKHGRPNESRFLESLVLPAYEARHSEKKRAQ